MAGHPGNDDPFLAREQQKYSHPIVSREFILKWLSERKGPASHARLCEELGIASADDVEALRRRLIAMERDGQLIRNRRDAYLPVDKMDSIAARVQGHKDGFGFAVPGDGSADLYLGAREMRKVFDGDLVLVRKVGEDRRGRPEGVIVEVVEHRTWALVGRYFEERGVAFVRAENRRIQHEILIPPGEAGHARHGNYVMIELIQQPGPRQLPQGRVVELLGEYLAPGLEIEIALRSHQLPHRWSEEVEREAARLGDSIAADELTRRVDLRSLPFVTIDGEDARDFDDAVLCERQAHGGFLLRVAIADVAHYVPPGSALDAAAHERGTSVYFPSQVVPMLPEALSNGLCSLKPRVDRLVLVCEMVIDRKGQIDDFCFYEGIIHSHARLTYSEVAELLAAPAEAPLRQQSPHHPLLPQLENLHALYRVLHQARRARGAIDFDTLETRILFDAERKIERIVPVVRNDAHRLIEEAMLAANVCAARLLLHHKVPALFRVHEVPDETKLTRLHAYLAELGLSLSGGKKPSPKQMQKLLDTIAARPDAHHIQMVMLRSMRQALYQPENLGHFGLGYEAYTHFTSPIRRYPDLLVHRAIRATLRSRKPAQHLRRVKGAGVLRKQQVYPYDPQGLALIGQHCSQTERRADAATRDVVDWLKCEYLRAHVGSEFDGLITSVVAFGLFVELRDIFVEGLVHITALPNDYYHFEESKHRLVGERGRAVYRLGDPLRVKVVRVDLDERTIDFEPVLQRPAATPGSGKGGKKNKATQDGTGGGKRRRRKSG
ncbi:MAG TPA: ribonuclease R [Pseudomonadales bacterium]|jgi:ribonuclease R|nr:ribonuclease R [Pseudomonadales bacterium]